MVRVADHISSAETVANMEAMANPWLEVPLSDYEGHMNSAGVLQLAALADSFAEALACCRPESVAVAGIAGGNGLDRIDAHVTRRVVGIDINPDYLDAVRQRYGQMPGLELICTDLAKQMRRFNSCMPRWCSNMPASARVWIMRCVWSRMVDRFPCFCSCRAIGRLV